MEHDDEEYAFTTHEDAAAFVKLLRQQMLSNIPQTIWMLQSEQLRSTLRNHVDALGHDVDDEQFMYGMLYGTLLTINLQSQSTEISVPTAMLATVMLDMLENPSGLTLEEIDGMRDKVDQLTRTSVFDKIARFFIRALG